jgi:hypothetical protein
MQPALLFILSLVAYVGGLLLVWKITSRLLSLGLDEGWFMGLAALDILGGLLIFGAILLSLAAFQGTIGVKIIDAILLLIVFMLSLRLALRSFRRGHHDKPILLGHVLSGCYCLFLSAASIYAIVQLFRA